MSATLLEEATAIIESWKESAGTNTSPRATQLRLDLAVVHAALVELGTKMNSALTPPVVQRFRYTHSVDVNTLRGGHGRKALLLSQAVRDLTTSTAQALVNNAGNYGGFTADLDSASHTIRLSYSIDAVQYPPPPWTQIPTFLTSQQMMDAADKLTHV